MKDYVAAPGTLEKCLIRTPCEANVEITYTVLEVEIDGEGNNNFEWDYPIRYVARLKRAYYHRFLTDVRYHHTMVFFQCQYSRVGFLVRGILRYGLFEGGPPEDRSSMYCAELVLNNGADFIAVIVFHGDTWEGEVTRSVLLKERQEF